jgi:hypothetical protein
MTYDYIIMWHDDVIEMLFNYTVQEKQQIIDILADRPTKQCPNIKHLLLKATADGDRKYEIWLFGTDTPETEIYQQWDQDSELVKAAIRKVGDSVLDSTDQVEIYH